MKSQGKPKQRRYKEQGDKLRDARGERSLDQVRISLGLKHVQTYQNWELGYNRPDVSRWALLHAVLGVDAYGIYGGLKAGPQKRTERDQTIKAGAVRPILANIRKQLELLERMVGPAAADAAVLDAGYDPHKRKQKAKA